MFHFWEAGGIVVIGVASVGMGLLVPSTRNSGAMRPSAHPNWDVGCFLIPKD